MLLQNREEPIHLPYSEEVVDDSTSLFFTEVPLCLVHYLLIIQ